MTDKAIYKSSWGETRFVCFENWRIAIQNMKLIIVFLCVSLCCLVWSLVNMTSGLNDDELNSWAESERLGAKNKWNSRENSHHMIGMFVCCCCCCGYSVVAKKLYIMWANVQNLLRQWLTQPPTCRWIFYYYFAEELTERRNWDFNWPNIYLTLN